MRFIKLNIAEKHELECLYKTSTNSTVRKRSHCLLLSNKGKTINELIVLFDSSRRTIERLFNGWEKEQLKSLSIAEGRGAKKRLVGYEDIIKEQLVLHNRNLKMVVLYIKEELNIKICKRTLLNFLKDTGL